LKLFATITKNVGKNSRSINTSNEDITSKHSR